MFGFRRIQQAIADVINALRGGDRAGFDGADLIPIRVPARSQTPFSRSDS